MPEYDLEDPFSDQYTGFSGYTGTGAGTGRYDWLGTGIGSFGSSYPIGYDPFTGQIHWGDPLDIYDASYGGTPFTPGFQPSQQELDMGWLDLLQLPTGWDIRDIPPYDPGPAPEPPSPPPVDWTKVAEDIIEWATGGAKGPPPNAGQPAPNPPQNPPQQGFNPWDLLNIIPAILPLLTSAQGTNFLTPESVEQFKGPLLDNLSNYFAAGSTIPSNLDEAYKALTGLPSASPQANQMNQFISQGLQGGIGSELFAPGGQFADLQRQVTQTVPGYMTGASQLTGDLMSGRIPTQNPAQPLEEQSQQTLMNIIANQGMDPAFIQAARENIFDPADEALAGRLNVRTGKPGGGLPQELRSRQESRFLNDLILNSQQNLQNALGQGINLAGQRGAQTMDRARFGAGLQNQFFQQGLQGADFGTGRALETNRLLNDIALRSASLGQQNLANAINLGRGSVQDAMNLVQILSSGQANLDTAAAGKAQARGDAYAQIAQAFLDEILNRG